MKKVISIIGIFFIVYTTNAQKKDTTKVDSAQLFFNEVGNSLRLNDFQQWIYDKVSAKKYDEFMQYYNAYMQEQFAEWLKKKKK